MMGTAVRFGWVMAIIACLLPSPLSAQPDAGPDATAALVENWINMSGQFNDRLLTTVYWALGAIGTLLVALVGFSWFANYRLYDRDKAAMLAELQGQVSQQITDLRNEVTNLQNRQREAVAAAVKDAAAAQVRTVARKLEDVDGSARRLGSNLSRVNKTLQMHVANIDARFWDIESVPVNSLGCYVEAGQLGHELGYIYMVERALDKIEAIIRKGGRRGPHDSDLVGFLEMLPDNYEPARARIKALLTSRAPEDRT